MSQQQTSNTITLRGSAQIICEYLNAFIVTREILWRYMREKSFKSMLLTVEEFPRLEPVLGGPSEYAINSVLFQRGLYPPETFKAEQQYGITLLLSEDPDIKKFLMNLLSQSEEWIVSKKVRKLSLVIINVANKEVLECWDFNVQYEDGDPVLSKEKNETVGTKELKKIQQEIRDVMLQVAATISYLPFLDCRCSFDVYVHAKTDCEIPEKWAEAESVSIANAQNVQLKTFSTSLHKMETVVTYKLVD